MKIKIIRAKKENIKDVGILFDLYRQFYKYNPELKKSTKYINCLLYTSDAADE